MSDFEIYFPEPKTGIKRPAVWRDRAGVLHRAIGAQMIPRNHDTFIMWTACQKKDVPAGQAWLQNVGDHVTCEGCRQAEAVFEEDERGARVANGRFGVGA